MHFRTSIAILLIGLSRTAGAQHGYEFEVYGTDIGRKGSSEIELHTNFVPDGLKEAEESQLPSHRAVRSSFEFAHTLNSWLQASLYASGFAGPDRGLSFVGNRLRLTAVAPSKWGLPFNLGIANEISYARPGFSENRWAYELTPIIAKSFGNLSLTFNPAIERGLGRNSHHDIEVEPRGKAAYQLGDEATLSVEYYAGLGGIGEGYAVRDQRHQLFTRVKGEVAPRLEVGVGIGRGLTPSSDRWVIATVFEYELHK
ncbi:MAG: hypothetical protein ABI681_01025 [Gemmatimonadales bacterium]